MCSNSNIVMETCLFLITIENIVTVSIITFYILHILTKTCTIGMYVYFKPIYCCMINDFGVRKDSDYTETCGKSVIAAEYIVCKIVHFLVFPDFKLIFRYLEGYFDQESACQEACAYTGQSKHSESQIFFRVLSGSRRNSPIV